MVPGPCGPRARSEASRHGVCEALPGRGRSRANALACFCLKYLQERSPCISIALRGPFYQQTPPVAQLRGRTERGGYALGYEPGAPQSPGERFRSPSPAPLGAVPAPGPGRLPGQVRAPPQSPPVRHHSFTERLENIFNGAKQTARYEIRSTVKVV